MKIAVQVVKYLVGLLFIVSGLVKANDPLGLSYKMQEFFLVWRDDLAGTTNMLKTLLTSLINFSDAHSLALSVMIIALEIMAGVALLMGWQKRAVLGLLLVLIVFFTFLTGYAYNAGKFKNCGCFGDCLPITPFASFVKDLLLLAAILFLIVGRKYIQPIATRSLRVAILTSALVLSIFFQWYVLHYSPVVDCLPFKEGNNITEQMQIPKNAVPDSFAIRFVYEKGGKQFEFSPEQLPADLATYQFIDRKDKLIRKGNAEPAIKGFFLSDESGDYTASVLQEPYVVLYFYNSENGMASKAKRDFKMLYNSVFVKRKIPIVLVSSSLQKVLQNVDRNECPGALFYNTDFTVFRTAARTNPTVYLLNKGTIMHKWSEKKAQDAADFIENKYMH